jgi:hypothetical protein
MRNQSDAKAIPVKTSRIQSLLVVTLVLPGLSDLALEQFRISHSRSH